MFGDQGCTCEEEKGNTIKFITPGGKALHSCNYIADNLVYKKYGSEVTTPWCFMKLGDVIQTYSMLEWKTSVQVRYLILKHLHSNCYPISLFPGVHYLAIWTTILSLTI